ncbi:MAG TPA: hypothetical protein EYO73_00020, partial [Sulfurimonas sp.]|nr:hypothetical protein [Sulfurimonas sp.]
MYFDRFSNDDVTYMLSFIYGLRMDTMAASYLLIIPLSLLVFIGIRSSFGHRAANSSDAMYSTNRVINEITKNTLYNVAYSIYANKKFASKVLKQYGNMPINEALSRVAKRLDINI